MILPGKISRFINKFFFSIQSYQTCVEVVLNNLLLWIIVLFWSMNKIMELFFRKTRGVAEIPFTFQLIWRFIDRIIGNLTHESRMILWFTKGGLCQSLKVRSKFYAWQPTISCAIFMIAPTPLKSEFLMLEELYFHYRIFERNIQEE